MREKDQSIRKTDRTVLIENACFKCKFVLHGAFVNFIVILIFRMMDSFFRT